jgi:hypothetical protein
MVKVEESDFISRIALRKYCYTNNIEINDNAFNQMIEWLYEISNFYRTKRKTPGSLAQGM